ncbi:TPR-like protein [Choiromyces venosus 120613-1]|uniref:TPR-like protein n=1 Tax=Choiromyces venosus 120613-1 TaxID=1336337 RepID=A0A3N4J3A7_9PEZI|nr:TPR-like protein [Choiromyces venosus 120613-1]
MCNRNSKIPVPIRIMATRVPGLDFFRKYEPPGNLSDLNIAITEAEKASEAHSSDDPNRIRSLNSWSAMLLMRFERQGDLKDLQSAICKSEEVVGAGNIGHTSALANLSVMFIRRFERIGNPDDVQQAIKHGEEALAATPQDHPDRADMYNNLGNMLFRRFNRTGDLDDLQRAIKHGETALAVTPRDHLNRITIYNSLGSMLSRRFERIGDLDDLQQAIKHGEAALAVIHRDHSDRVGIYNNLGNMYSTRFEWTGDLDDLQQAIKHGEAALAATPRDHPSRASIHNNLGNMFSAIFERIGDFDDLQQAIKHGETALAAIPQDHPDRAGIYNNLSNISSMRFGRTEDPDDFQKAIKYGEAALATIPRDHPDRTAIYHNLGNKFFARFEQIRNPDDLQQAIKHGEAALASTPLDHPQRSLLCTCLGHKLLLRSPGTGSGADRSESLRLFLEAWHSVMSPPKDRITGARRAAQLLYSAGNFGESSSILEDAVNLMPRVNLRSLKRDDQQYILSALSGLAAIASSVALQAGNGAYNSLKLLELGRGVIMGFAIDSRSDISELQADYPHLCDKFDRLRAEIDSPMNEIEREQGGTPDQCRDRAISRRREAIDEMENIISYIRTLPGYTGFLLPPSPDTLMKMAENGPIVVFNSTSYRSDAIIVTASAITSLELPKLDHEETGRWMKKLASFGGSGFKRHQDNKQLKELLIWLWDAAAGPVFDELYRCRAFSSAEIGSTNLKRIWWIGVGFLSMAPFHAAGDHSRGSTRNTSSRAISTYIPTIKALSYSRQTKFQLFDECDASFSPERPKNARLLLVPMPETPGASRLPGVDQEIKSICDSATENAFATTVLNNPTPADVLKQVQHHDITHFACHGVSEINPSDSHLVLLTPDGENADKLMVRDISNASTRNSKLAYLSACCSAKNSSNDLADEVIHLASEFQLAGFSHVLATMWDSDDQACLDVAKEFYRLLFNCVGNDDGHQKVAIAFHEAVKKVRDKRPQNPLTWGTFIHSGA